MKVEFLEIENHLLNDNKPSEYLKSKLINGELNKYPFSMISDLNNVEQNPKYHPEGNVFIHTMMVVDEGAKHRNESKNKRAFMWALLLHDIGKKPATKLRKGKITSYNHDVLGMEMAKEFLEFFDQDYSFIKKVTALIRWHMQILFVNKNMKFQNIKEMLEEVDRNEIILVCLCDRFGRGNIKNEEVLQDVDNFRKIIYKYDIK